MDAFENLVALLLRREGYWTATSVKVELSRKQKHAIGRPSSPRWEIDLVAYKGETNELLAVECKSYLDSRGVVFRNGKFEPAERYKLFTEPRLRSVVTRNLATQLVNSGSCRKNPRVTLCLATGKMAGGTDRKLMQAHFDRKGWLLFDDRWVAEHLLSAASADYENDVAFVVAKILRRNGNLDQPV